MVENYYFCAAKERPDCLKETNLCCMHCDVARKCYDLNNKVKPCTDDVVDMDDECEFSI